MAERLDASTLGRLVAAATPAILIATANEARAEALVTRTAQGIRGMPSPRVWNCNSGFGTEEPADPLGALRWAAAQEGPGLFVFKDMGFFWGDPRLQRFLLDFIAGRRPPGKTLVFLAPSADLPPSLIGSFVVLDQGLPDREDISSFFEAAKMRDAALQESLPPEALLRLIPAAQGLDFPDMERALRLARIGRGDVVEETLAALFRQKRQILARSGIMEFVENEVRSEEVGGMENLKAWMQKREQAFGANELSAGRHLPKGVLVMGISGCGKSLFVKAIASRWGLPLIRLDMATVYAGTFGSPESSLRQACRTAESLSPCVLWIDEMEAGISTHGFKAEGGAASRVLGYFLTWMQEKHAPVFVAATANAIEMLPAEVLRKGRFDEIFYVSLPTVAEREEIFRIHLKSRTLDTSTFQTSMLAHSAKGFSGSEIEQAVAGACFEARSQGRQVTQQDLLESISRTVPLSVTMAEQIKRIEAWAFKRAVPASRGEAGR